MDGFTPDQIIEITTVNATYTANGFDIMFVPDTQTGVPIGPHFSLTRKPSEAVGMYVDSDEVVNAITVVPLSAIVSLKVKSAASE